MKKKKVMIVAHFCGYGKETLNNRFNYLAERLADTGIEVEILTSSFSHKDKKQRVEEKDLRKGYKSTLIYEPSYQKNVSFKRLLISHPTMARNLGKYLLLSEKPDLIYCAIPSVDVATQAARYARKWNIPFVLDVQDLWPEAYKLALKNGFLYKAVNAVLKKPADKVYGAADKIVAVSETYAKRALSVNKKCQKALAVYLGTDVSTFDRNVKENKPLYYKPENEFWLGYCGTLGHSYDLITVMEAMKLSEERGVRNLRLVVVGNGPLEERFKQKAAELDVQCTFTGKLPYGQMCAQLVQCDVAVNPIVAESVASIINKHADYAVAGLPVINTQDSEEYRNLLMQYGCGINCEPGSVRQVADAIEMLVQNTALCEGMAEGSRKMGLEKFDRENIYGDILKELWSLL